LISLLIRAIKVVLHINTGPGNRLGNLPNNCARLHVNVLIIRRPKGLLGLKMKLDLWIGPRYRLGNLPDNCWALFERELYYLEFEAHAHISDKLCLDELPYPKHHIFIRCNWLLMNTPGALVVSHVKAFMWEPSNIFGAVYRASGTLFLGCTPISTILQA
ncbi:hypothetical protein ACJX0J_034446, partial [Zea mays]